MDRARAALRCSITAEELIGHQGEDHDIQGDDQEQSDLHFLVMLSEPAVDGLQLLMLDELVTFLAASRVLLKVNPARTSCM